MLYAALLPDSIDLALFLEKPGTGPCVVLSPWDQPVAHSPISDRLFRTFSRTRIRAMRSERATESLELHLDPWLLALGLVMWEGIVRGMDWESVKPAVFKARHQLRRKGLAPTSPRPTAGRRFTWAEFCEGRKLQTIFVRLRQQHEGEPSRLRAVSALA